MRNTYNKDRPCVHTTIIRPTIFFLYLSSSRPNPKWEVRKKGPPPFRELSRAWWQLFVASWKETGSTTPACVGPSASNHGCVAYPQLELAIIELGNRLPIPLWSNGMGEAKPGCWVFICQRWDLVVFFFSSDPRLKMGDGKNRWSQTGHWNIIMEIWNFGRGPSVGNIRGFQRISCEIR